MVAGGLCVGDRVRLVGGFIRSSGFIRSGVEGTIETMNASGVKIRDNKRRAHYVSFDYIDHFAFKQGEDILVKTATNGWVRRTFSCYDPMASVGKYRVSSGTGGSCGYAEAKPLRIDAKRIAELEREIERIKNGQA